MTLTVESILLSLLSAILGGLVVAFANHWMTRKREHEKKTTDVRIEYLIDCCLQLERASCPRPDMSGDEINKCYEEIERALPKIMPMGDAVEVEAVRKFAKNFATNRTAPIDEILDSLRSSLRRKLGLEPAGKWDAFLRIGRLKP